MNETLPCGHDKKFYYFHPGLIGSLRHRCIKCDDPNGNTVAMQQLTGWQKTGDSIVGTKENAAIENLRDIEAG